MSLNSTVTSCIELPTPCSTRSAIAGEKWRARFETRELSYGAYFFPDLSGTSEADELAAIDAGQIQANRIQYHGSRRESRT